LTGEKLWSIEPHTQAKHEILKNYLQAWFPILGRTPKHLIYLDGFAGPGMYKGGEEGSPVIALRTYLEHNQKENIKAHIFFVFFEEKIQRANYLRTVIKGKFPELPRKCEYEVIDTRYESAMDYLFMLLERDKMNLAPTFAFLDPCGYSGLPMRLNKKLLKYPKCEVLITFMSGFINRFLSNEAILDELFGTDEWQQVHTIIDPRDRKEFLIRLYKRQLSDIAGAKYALTFEMVNRNNQTIYYLVFGTKHLTGLDRMKMAMTKVDRTGNFKFSDLKDPKQRLLIDYSTEDHWVPAAAKLVFKKFSGQEVPVKSIQEFVLAETPYLFKKSLILKYLEQADSPKILRVTRGTKKRRKYTYPSGSLITFR
jgi:three-Cys-motif partner protein